MKIYHFYRKYSVPILSISYYGENMFYLISYRQELTIFKFHSAPLEDNREETGSAADVF